jgi:UDP-N-acetylglucosamine--dolichyl-phosphate N-acetylglucosaminephosphotransferase
MIIWIFFLAALATASSAYLITDYLSHKFNHLAITGIDVHKPTRPSIPEMGGLAVLFSVPIGSLILFALGSSLGILFVTGLASVLLTGLIGVADDLLGLRQRYKPFLIAAASSPVALALLGKSGIYFPLAGTIHFGIFFPLVIVPLAITTSANFSNMLAGFNGLEAGCAVISLGTMTILCALKNELGSMLLGLLFFSGYLAFLALNWYPSRIFPGDTGTLMSGAAVAVLGLISGLEFAAIVLSIPAGLDFTLKLLSKNPFSARSRFGDAKINGDGTLVPASYPALAHAFMRVSSLTEKELVKWILAMQTFYAVIAVVITQII